MDEAKLAARLSHPNVVQTFEAFQDGNRYLLAMEYLDGQSLSALITRMAGETTRELQLGVHIHILCEVLSGLHYAHELRDYDGSRLRVVHRDVSPQNVFLTYHGEVKVVDFGVAKAANAANSTAPGVFVGKFAYAAPEQILGRPVDARTDVFAVGVMLWQAIARRRFSLASPTPEAFRGRAEGVEPRIRAVVRDVDPELAEICDRAIEVDPDKRFATAQAFRAALQAYLETRNVRVQDADLGHLMQQVFDQERATLHAQIEAVVQASGTQADVEPLSFLAGDKEPTAVADLSSLVDISVQRDDQQIRAAYANTKLTRLPSQSSRGGPARAKQRLRWAATGCGLAAALGALVWMLNGSEDTVVQAKSLAPALVTVEHNQARVPGVESLELVLGAATISPAPPATVVKPRPTEPHKTAANKPVRPSAPVARKAKPVRVAKETLPVAPPAKPARIEAGADLGTTRRAAPERIDVENPY
jgi:serine/threonine-protein kinase